MDTVTTASTGNAAVSTCVGAAAIGMRAAVFVPPRCDPNKLLRMSACGAEVFTVDAGYAAAAKLSRQLAAGFGWIDRNDANDLTLDGNKTISFEIWEQLGRRVPDVVVVSVGDGTTLSGLAKGFREIREEEGVRLPRLIGIQAETCQPLVRLWRGEQPGSEDLHPEATAAEGLAVAEPHNVERTLKDVSDSSGCLLSVTETEIARGGTALAAQAGVLADPAAAAAFAGFKAALGRAIIRRTEETVVVITGRSTIAPEGTRDSRGKIVSATVASFEREMARIGRQIGL